MSEVRSPVGAASPRPSAWPARLALLLWRQQWAMWQHVARYRIWYALGVAAIALVAPRVYVNLTDSLPHRLVWLERGAGLGRGELAIFRFDGGPVTQPINGRLLLKHVAGVPGDSISVKGRHVYVNEQWIGRAEERSPRGTALEPIAPGVIPPGHYFVAGKPTGSLDSRYSAFGLVPARQVIGRARVIF